MPGADLLGDGNVKVTICLTLSSVPNPPATELNNGVDLQMLIIKEGLGIEPDQSPVDNSALGSRSETERAGTAKYAINLTCKRKILAIEDIAYSTLVPGQDCYLAVRRNRPHEEAWEAGDAAEIYPIQCGIRKMQPPVLNEAQRFIQQEFNHSDSDVDAVVA